LTETDGQVKSKEVQHAEKIYATLREMYLTVLKKEKSINKTELHRKILPRKTKLTWDKHQQT